MLDLKSEWPDQFDFETDGICQSVFKPFILDQLEKLEAYDAQRPEGITYIFHQHAERVARDAEDTCLHMGLGKIVARNMYWALLPHDIGKRLLPPAIWDQEEKPDGELKAQRRSHTTLGVTIVDEQLADSPPHPFKDLMTDIMLNHHEQMDGKGFRGLTADQISMPVRLAAIVEAFDGWSTPRPHFGERDISIPAVLARMREEKSEWFDKDLLESFADMKMKQHESMDRTP